MVFQSFRKRSSLLFLILILAGAMSSCSSFHQAAVSTSSPLLYKATAEMETERDWDLFAKGIPGNIKLIEGLAYINPEDDDLLVTLLKAHAGYAFAVHETKWLADFYEMKDESSHKEKALIHYSKAFRYGLRYFKEQGIDYKSLKSSISTDRGVVGYLNEYLDDEDVQDLEAALFAGQSLASLVNLQRDNMIMVGELPLAKGLFDWVCEKRPKINFGTCQIFYGSYEAGRPTMLGGNPRKGEKIFKDFIKENPKNWLAQAAYMQYVLIPLVKEEEFKKYAEKFEGYLEQHKKTLIWNPSEVQGQDAIPPRLRFYRSLALERYKIMKKYQKDFF